MRSESRARAGSESSTNPVQHTPTPMHAPAFVYISVSSRYYEISFDPLAEFHRWVEPILATAAIIPSFLTL